MDSAAAANQLHILLASGRALLERVEAEELDPRTVVVAYEQWYTPTVAAVGVLVPERRAEFESYYRRTAGVGSPTPPG